MRNFWTTVFGARKNMLSYGAGSRSKTQVTALYQRLEGTSQQIASIIQSELSGDRLYTKIDIPIKHSLDVDIDVVKLNDVMTITITTKR